MYQLGLGKSPKYPAERMNDEMIGFLDLCFETDPKQRGDVGILLKHPFVEVNNNDCYFKVLQLFRYWILKRIIIDLSHFY